MASHIEPSSGVIIAMIIYFVAMIIIGIYGYMRTSNLDDYMLGGRSLPPAVAALSAGAADMSGWLLMGLPGALYLNGMISMWIAIGLTIGQWINWKVVAPRLRVYTEVSGNSITVPSYFSHRLKDTSKSIRVVAGLVILIFFTLYVASGMVAGGTFFESLGMNYHTGMVLVAAIVILYTLVGGFLAVSWTDTVQGIMMLVALVLVPAIGINVVGGWNDMISTVTEANPHLWSFIGEGWSTESVMEVVNGLVWGLGYFGMPHIIVRFMALRTPREATAARRIGIGWMALSLLGAVFTAFVGRAAAEKGLVPLLMDESGKTHPEETVFLQMGNYLFPALLAGFMLAAILAAIMSTVSSQLLVTSSALVEDVYRAFTTKDISGKNGVLLGRVAVLAVSVIAGIMAWQRADSILSLVSFAWAGFGAAFGPIVILSLYWRRLTWQGALSGMIVGAAVSIAWHNLPQDLFILFGVYEILPGFLFNLLVAWLVSKATWKETPEIDEEFDEMLRRLKLTKEEYAQLEPPVQKAPKGAVPQTVWKMDTPEHK